MSPERKTEINGHKVHEYYWAGEYPVYVDNRLTVGKFEDIVERLKVEGSADGADAKRRDHE